MGRYCEEAIADMLGSDWESYICPLSGPSELCYVDRNSEECKKCEEEFMKYHEERNNGKEKRS